MTKFGASFYDVKYKFHWWWYDGGAGKTAEGIVGTTLIFVAAYGAWWLAYLMDP
jgi:hypothetical protein